MGVRIRDESGFGLLELLIAMVVLNVGLFAVIGVFNGATVAIARASKVSSATAVADKQMEIYRSLMNCAIWLDPASFPTKGAGSTYEADVKSYTNLYQATPAPVAFLDKTWDATTMANAYWSTSATTSAGNGPGSGSIPTACIPSGGALSTTSTPTISSTQAIQTVQGPDGVWYPVYTYMILLQPTVGASAGWVKQVTVVVRDQQTPTKILARQTSLFNPLSG